MVASILSLETVPQFKPKKHKYDVLDFGGRGLALTVFPSGKRSFVHLYKFLRKSRRLTFGPYPDISLEEARHLHIESRKIFLLGKDPALQKWKFPYHLQLITELEGRGFPVDPNLILSAAFPKGRWVGIYFLIDPKEEKFIVYVGMGQYTPRRLDEHRREGIKKYSRIVFLPIDLPPKELVVIEDFYIGLFNPKYNIGKRLRRGSE